MTHQVLTAVSAHALLLLSLGGCTVGMPAASQESAAGMTLPGCSLPGNCVSTADASGLPPLVFTGSGSEAMATLLATIATFKEATIVQKTDLGVESVFTTPAGFRDIVEFRIDPQRRRIDFRSRSSFGLFDFGKNRSRMTEFSARFETTVSRPPAP